MTTTPTKNESLPELPVPSGHAGYFTAEDMWSYARAALIREAPTEGVPDGWKLVPMVATDAMVEAGWRLHGRAAYESMVEAAPTPPAPQRVAQGEAVKWWNGCDRTVPAALRYLANNPRPQGGQSDFNAEHLYQLAAEIERMARTPLYTAPQVEAKQQGPGEVIDSGALDRAMAAYDANWPKGTRPRLKMRAALEAALLPAPQVEAKRQTGEGESPSLKRIIPAAHPYPKPDQVTGADTGSIGEHAYADGWNDCRKAMIAAAAKPSGGVES